ncbi:ABC transporter ATP-binding protein [Kocuria sp.]|uniref:ABC transporter ATP-binding protein n=1 Tax=Kocuria sp. TaxID=1871328 RepID=UPI0026DFC1B2|nr:ABC transporter ATP-binding protein [Kocuria sp.]MDO5619335.1 ABC transporter ATP-binding protein [Kocuria sp.]
MSIENSKVHLSNIIVRATGIRKAFPYGNGRTQNTVLNGIDFELRNSEFVAIVGPSGSGKSTLLYCLSGLEELSDGHVKIFDQDLSAMSKRQKTIMRRDRIGFIFQSYNLIPSLNVVDNVTVPGWLNRRLGARARAKAAISALGMTDLSRAYPETLSGGQQQRVAIARVLASQADIIFADEPTGALDSKSGNNVLHLLREFVDNEGRSVIMVTHDLQLASVADRVIVMQDGLIYSELSHPDSNTILQVMQGLPSAGSK